MLSYRFSVKELVTSPGVVHVNVVHLFTCTTPEHVQQDIQRHLVVKLHITNVMGICIWFSGEEETNRLNDQFNSLLMMWWKFIVRFEIMTFSDRSCLWVHFMVISAEFTQHHGCSKGNWLHIQKARTYTKRCFPKTWYMRKQPEPTQRGLS